MTAPFRHGPKVRYSGSEIVTAVEAPTGATKPSELTQETPVAFVFDGTTAAVMMASPMDIQDFAFGFAMTEGFLSGPDDIEEFEQVAHESGIEAQFWLRTAAAQKIVARRRVMMGPVGCGLCGLDSLEQAIKPVARIPDRKFRVDTADAASATDLLRNHQALHDRTRSAHAAGFLLPGQGIVLVREDVGRHNALDKLLGALIRGGIDPSFGAVVMTSRVSVELVQKTAAMGCPMLIAVSSPTAYAVELADQAGLTLVANTRNSTCEVYTHAHRIRLRTGSLCNWP